MSRELDFYGYWEGDATYYCDNCHKPSKSFRFDSEDIDSRSHREFLKKQGWYITKVLGKWKDFCCEDCRNDYIKKNT